MLNLKLGWQTHPRHYFPSSGGNVVCSDVVAEDALTSMYFSLVLILCRPDLKLSILGSGPGRSGLNFRSPTRTFKDTLSS